MEKVSKDENNERTNLMRHQRTRKTQVTNFDHIGKSIWGSETFHQNICNIVFLVLEMKKILWQYCLGSIVKRKLTCCIYYSCKHHEKATNLMTGSGGLLSLS